MKLEQQVPSLELCKKLKELGYPQESFLYWEEMNGAYIRTATQINPNWMDVTYSAPTVAELGEMLPTKWAELLLGNQGGSLVSIFKIQGDLEEKVWSIVYDTQGQSPFTKRGEKIPKPVFKQVFDENEAIARAKMLIYLLENKLVKL